MILFTKKEKLTPFFLAAVAEVKDRIRVYVVHVAEKNPNPEAVELAEEHGAKDLPKLIVRRSFDTKINEKRPYSENFNYNNDSFKIPDLLAFFEKHTRKTKKEDDSAQNDQ